MRRQRQLAVENEQLKERVRRLQEKLADAEARALGAENARMLQVYADVC
jgi:hypothetical protein